MAISLTRPCFGEQTLHDGWPTVGPIHGKGGLKVAFSAAQMAFPRGQLHNAMEVR
jgi:hypothetical protein